LKYKKNSNKEKRLSCHHSGQCKRREVKAKRASHRNKEFVF